MSWDKPVIIVVGLGYVGLPLAVTLAEKYETHGLDISAARIGELRDGRDRTGEITPERLRASPLRLTDRVEACPPADIYIVTVPTPVHADTSPDLSPVLSAARAVGGMLVADRRPIVVFESTVYPGVTEGICATELERVSGLRCGEDFFLGYSPERINPGDREHTIDRITKVVSGQTLEVLDALASVYASITSGGVFRAASIKAAEAAKVIENAQRDINIAFMNELAQIFSRMDLSVWDVLAAARTKWNFLGFEPGLVGGHCIGVDPYYLAHRAAELGYDPRVILSGRETNDAMAQWVADTLHARRGGRPGSVLVLGLTFKQDVPDLRNSKVADMVAALSRLGHAVTAHDPLADAAEAEHEFGIALAADALERRYDMVVLAVPHAAFLRQADTFAACVAEGGLWADLKNALPHVALPVGCTRWTL